MAAETTSTGAAFDEFMRKKKQEFIVDYCMHKLWQEFSRKLPLSMDAIAEVQGLLTEKGTTLNKEIRDKRLCTRFFCGLSGAVSVDADGNKHYKPLKYKCLGTLKKIFEVGLYPFSISEKAQMLEKLSVQVVLSLYRSGSSELSQQAFDRLFKEADVDEEISEDLTELLQTENQTVIDAILKKYSYEVFLERVCELLTPFWNQFDKPVLAQHAEYKPSTNTESISLQLLQTFHDHIHQEEEWDMEESWTAIINETHPDILKWKTRSHKQADAKKSPSKAASSGSPWKGMSPYKRKRAPRKTKQAENSDDESSSECENECRVLMSQTKKVIERLKKSSKKLNEHVKDPYTKSSTESDNKESDDEGQPTKKSPAKSPKRTSTGQVKRKPPPRKWNDAQENAEILQWTSDEDDDLNPPVVLPALKKKMKCGSKKHPWTSKEVEWLVEGVRVLGRGNWAQILRRYPFPPYRTSVHLKDKWRIL